MRLTWRFPSVLFFASFLLVVWVKGCCHDDDNGVYRQRQAADNDHTDTLKRMGTESMEEKGEK
ncbi:hypothetical protein P691DRAFT_805429 [Macrolepiota fuliginosa MF-IS2]|uniref:Secreted protein n=1 Tax=Macrolepiota fuliginosa MF-IS2 TaxID=1400762 RepID=A0A9P5X6C7_9AGAR|nr:hypothetical protein P691DRAFT_805429 [Macrolepiota fuliginosa MF-IS2]